MEDETKPSFKPKFKSEFSMGEYDFKRYDLWLGRTELSSATIDSYDIPSLELVQRYFSELNILYKSWKPLISSPKLKEELNSMKREAKTKKRVWEQSRESGLEFNKNAIFYLVDLLDSFHEKLLEIKQVIGLGIVVKKSVSMKEKIKYGIRPKPEYSELPEA